MTYALRRLSRIEFLLAFADELVKQYGRRSGAPVFNNQDGRGNDVLDIEGNSVRDYAKQAADGYYDDPDMWEAAPEDGQPLPSIDPEACAEMDLEYWEWEG